MNRARDIQYLNYTDIKYALFFRVIFSPVHIDELCDGNNCTNIHFLFFITRSARVVYCNSEFFI